MLHSAWDMEIYARTQQNDRMREAAKARQLEAAGLGWSLLPSIIGWRVGQALAATRGLFLGRRPAAEPAAVLASVHLTAAAGSVQDRPVPRMKPAHAAEPYAAMVVIARAAATPVAERP